MIIMMMMSVKESRPTKSEDGANLTSMMRPYLRTAEENIPPPGRFRVGGRVSLT